MHPSRASRRRRWPGATRPGSGAARETSPDHARVQAICDYAGSPEAPRERTGEEDVGELRARVGGPGGPAPLPVQVRDVDVPAAVCIRGGGHDARRGRRLQPVEQQVRQQERGEVVDRHRELEPIGRDRTSSGDEPGVVDENVDPLVALEERRGDAAYLGERREVCHEWLGTDLPGDRSGAPLVAADGNDRGAAFRELDRGRAPDPRARAGDHDGDVSRRTRPRRSRRMRPAGRSVQRTRRRAPER